MTCAAVLVRFGVPEALHQTGNEPGTCCCHRVHGRDVWIGLPSGQGPTSGGWPGCGGRPCREFVLFPPEGGLALELIL